MSSRKRDKKRTIIVRRDEVVESRHHGGAWKVAYADFVTAMMAFFLLMWLLNATTQEQKRGLADYFSPNSHVSILNSGSGAPLAGQTPNTDGSQISNNGAIELTRTQPYPVVDDDDSGDKPTQVPPSKVPGTAPKPSASDGGAQAGRSPAETRSPDDKAADKAAQAENERHERREFEQAAHQIRDAVASDPALADMAKQLAIDVTPEGLRIQLLDADRTPMFSTGSSALNDRARALLAKISPVLVRMPEPVAIAGHTDAAPYRGSDKSNWDLSAERANATRRLLVDAGLPEGRLRSVTGNADRDPLIVDDPLAAANRRIAILLLRERPSAKR
jgi:chemotaxis protein MotB